MNNLVPIIFIALAVYLIFFRRRGMGCCGGHDAHESKESRNLNKESYSHDENIIDLSEDDYTTLPSKNDKISW